MSITCKITKEGLYTKEIWYKDDIIHKDNDEPAVIISFIKPISTIKIWYINGKIHRDYHPAIVHTYEYNLNRYEFCWCKNNKLYRDDDYVGNRQYSYISVDEDSIYKIWHKYDENLYNIEYKSDTFNILEHIWGINFTIDIDTLLTTYKIIILYTLHRSRKHPAHIVYRNNKVIKNFYCENGINCINEEIYL